MKPSLNRFACTFAFTLLTLPMGVAAAEITCPSLADVVQVANCPSEDELVFTYNGYCSDNRRMYTQGPDVCRDYQLYRKLKNVVLWETKDGKFHAYLSCDLPPDAMKQAKVSKITVGKDGKMTRVACSYGEDITFSYRTHETCRADSAAACATEPGACKARCE